MGATSITGVGTGIAANQKGPGNNRNYFVPEVCPHIVAAGTVTTATNVATVTFPVALALAAANYVVVLTTVDAAAAARGVSVTAKTDVASQFSSFSIISEAAAQVVEYAVITTGFGLDVAV